MDGNTRRRQVENAFGIENLFLWLSDSRKAMLRSQGGLGAGQALWTCPVSKQTTFTPQLFRVVLLRRSNLPLPFTARNFQCGRPLHFVAITEQLELAQGCWEGEDKP